MATREEICEEQRRIIREVIAKRSFKQDTLFTTYSWGYAPEEVKELFRHQADEYLSDLHSQGVVIKVDRELPFVSSNYELSEHKVYVKIGNKALSEQGYEAVESLILDKTP